MKSKATHEVISFNRVMLILAPIIGLNYLAFSGILSSPLNKLLLFLIIFIDTILVKGIINYLLKKKVSSDTTVSSKDKINEIKRDQKKISKKIKQFENNELRRDEIWEKTNEDIESFQKISGMQAKKIFKK